MLSCFLDHNHWLGEKNIVSNHNTMSRTRHSSRLNVVKAWAELFHIVNQTALKQFLKMGHIMIKSWSNMQFQGGNFVIFMGNMLQLTNVGIPQWRGQKTPSHAELPIKCSTIAALSNSHSPPSLAEDLKGVAHISKAWVVAPLASERISELQLSCAGGEST